MKRTGVRLRAFAARWFDAAAWSASSIPLLADLQAEYEEAIGRGHIWRARWIWMGQLPVVCATIAAIAAYPLIQQTAKVVFDAGLPRGVAAWAANATLLIAAAIVWTRQPSDPASTQPSSA